MLSSSSKDECLGAVQNVEELSLVTGMVVADLLAILCSILFLLATLAYFFWVEKFRTTFIFIQANVNKLIEILPLGLALIRSITTSR